MVNNGEFRRKAEALADLEGQMLDLSASQTQYVDIDWELMGGAQKSRRQMAICLAAAAVCGIGLKFSPGGALSMMFGFGLLCALAGLYLAHARRDEARTTQKNRQGKQSRIDELQLERSRLIGELNRMRRADPALEGTYWWDAGVEPSIGLHRSMPGEVLPESIWKLNVLQTISVREREDGLYCEDLQKYTTAIPAADLQAMLDSNTAAVLYENPEIMAQDHEWFQMLQLYAVDVDCIQEIEGKTTTVRVDKEREMAAYCQKLDCREILFNGLINERLTTNREEALLGHKSVEEYLRDETFRSIAEQDYRSKLDREPDEYESTHYRKVFRGLCDTVFISCALIMVSVRPDTDGQTAMILVPRVPMDSIRMTIRSGSSPGGYLERYLGREALEIGQYRVQPSICMAADCLFTEELAAHMKLQPRDILAPRPASLTDAEWSYLIWRDRRK